MAAQTIVSSGAVIDGIQLSELIRKISLNLEEFCLFIEPTGVIELRPRLSCRICGKASFPQEYFRLYFSSLVQSLVRSRHFNFFQTQGHLLRPACLDQCAPPAIVYEGGLPVITYLNVSHLNGTTLRSLFALDRSFAIHPRHQTLSIKTNREIFHDASFVRSDDGAPAKRRRPAEDTIGGH